jgi:hypothetical protein
VNSRLTAVILDGYVVAKCCYNFIADVFKQVSDISGQLRLDHRDVVLNTGMFVTDRVFHLLALYGAWASAQVECTQLKIRTRLTASSKLRTSSGALRKSSTLVDLPSLNRE